MGTHHPRGNKCDVLIIGYGIAGVSAAIEAADRGARVLVLDRGMAAVPVPCQAGSSTPTAALVISRPRVRRSRLRPVGPSQTVGYSPSRSDTERKFRPTM